MIARPAKAWPQAPPGFQVQLYATGLKNPRLMRTAPNGDVFLAESEPGNIVVLRGMRPNGRAQTVSIFAEGLDKPFGIAFYPPGPIRNRCTSAIPARWCASPIAMAT